MNIINKYAADGIKILQTMYVNDDGSINQIDFYSKTGLKTLERKFSNNLLIEEISYVSGTPRVITTFHPNGLKDVITYKDGTGYTLKTSLIDDKNRLSLDTEFLKDGMIIETKFVYPNVSNQVEYQLRYFLDDGVKVPILRIDYHLNGKTESIKEYYKIKTPTEGDDGSGVFEKPYVMKEKNYDTKGNLTSFKEYNHWSNDNKKTEKFIVDNKVIQIIEYNRDGTIKSTTDFTYNDDGILTNKVEKDTDGNILSNENYDDKGFFINKIEYEYNNGNITKETEYNSDNQKDFSIIYDENGIIIAEVDYKYTNGFIDTAIYKKDDKVTKVEEYNPEGDIEKITNNTYEGDNLVEISVTDRYGNVLEIIDLREPTEPTEHTEPTEPTGPITTETIINFGEKNTLITKEMLNQTISYIDYNQKSINLKIYDVFFTNTFGLDLVKELEDYSLPFSYESLQNKTITSELSIDSQAESLLSSNIEFDPIDLYKQNSHSDYKLINVNYLENPNVYANKIISTKDENMLEEKLELFNDENKVFEFVLDEDKNVKSANFNYIDSITGNNINVVIENIEKNGYLYQLVREYDENNNLLLEMETDLNHIESQQNPDFYERTIINNEILGLKIINEFKEEKHLESQGLFDLSEYNLGVFDNNSYIYNKVEANNILIKEEEYNINVEDKTFSYYEYEKSDSSLEDLSYFLSRGSLTHEEKAEGKIIHTFDNNWEQYYGYIDQGELTNNYLVKSNENYTVLNIETDNIWLTNSYSEDVFYNDIKIEHFSTYDEFYEENGMDKKTTYDNYKYDNNGVLTEESHSEANYYMTYTNNYKINDTDSYKEYENGVLTYERMNNKNYLSPDNYASTSVFNEKFYKNNSIVKNYTNESTRDENNIITNDIERLYINDTFTSMLNYQLNYERINNNATATIKGYENGTTKIIDIDATLQLNPLTNQMQMISNNIDINYGSLTVNNDKVLFDNAFLFESFDNELITVDAGETDLKFTAINGKDATSFKIDMNVDNTLYVTKYYDILSNPSQIKTVDYVFIYNDDGTLMETTKTMPYYSAYGVKNESVDSANYGYSEENITTMYRTYHSTIENIPVNEIVKFNYNSEIKLQYTEVFNNDGVLVQVDRYDANGNFIKSEIIKNTYDINDGYGLVNADNSIAWALGMITDNGMYMEDLTGNNEYGKDIELNTTSSQFLNGLSLHNYNFNGSGVKIGLISDGLYGNHHNVVGGYNFASNTTDYSSTVTYEYDNYSILSKNYDKFSLNTNQRLSLADGAELYSLVVEDNYTNGNAKMSNVLNAINYAIDNNLDLVHLDFSFIGELTDDTDLRTTLQRAEDNDLLIITAATGDNINGLTGFSEYIKDYSNILAIAASSQLGTAIDGNVTNVENLSDNFLLANTMKSPIANDYYVNNVIYNNSNELSSVAVTGVASLIIEAGRQAGTINEEDKAEWVIQMLKNGANDSMSLSQNDNNVYSMMSFSNIDFYQNYSYDYMTNNTNYLDVLI